MYLLRVGATAKKTQAWVCKFYRYFSVGFSADEGYLYAALLFASWALIVINVNMSVNNVIKTLGITALMTVFDTVSGNFVF
jgi:hypothetical protein